MSYLKNQMGLLKFDKRLLEINLKSGALTKEEYDQHLATLNDDEAKAEKISFEPETETVSSPEEMNGHHPAAPETGGNPFAQPTTPTNNDPFGSGY